MGAISITKLVLTLTLVGEVILLFLITKEKGSFIKKLFIIFLIGITGWTATIFLNLWTHSIIIEKFIFAFAALFLTAQVLFTQLFPNSKFPQSLHIPIFLKTYWSIFVGGFFLLMSFWNGAVFSSLTFDVHGFTVVENGFLSNFYSIFALAFVAIPIFLLAYKFKRSNDLSIRSQLKYLIVGFSIFLGVNILTNSILPVFLHIYFLNAIGPVFSLILAGLIFYIIWRHEFLDIQTLKHLLNTERLYAQKLEEKVRERTEQIETMRVQERLLMQDISHAQQTSLTLLRADIEILKKSSSGESITILTEMEENIERSSQLMYDLLHVADLEIQTRTSYESVDMSTLVKKVAEYVSTLCAINKISLAYRIQPDIRLTGDSKQLEELLRILLSNSIKYRKLNTISVINLTLMRESDSTIISVADNGIGIAKEHIPFLFERFYRANTKTEGNGLGLAIAKAIAETHSGSISVHTAEDIGTEFIVRFKNT